MTDITQIIISSSDFRIGIDGNSKDVLSKLKVGQIIQGKVLKTVSPRQAQLLVLGQKVTAKTHLTLTAGENVLLRVSTAGPQSILKMIPPLLVNTIKPEVELLQLLGRSGPYDPLLQLLDSAATSVKGTTASPLASYLQKMAKLMQRATIRPDDSGAGRLQELPGKSGLAWESKLGRLLLPGAQLGNAALREMVEEDFKALAMQSLLTVPERDSESGKLLRTFVQNLEQFQLLNRAAFDDAGKIFLPLPFLSEGLLKFGQLVVHTPGGRRKEETGREGLIKVAFLLEMSNLGDMLAEFSILKKGITGAFTVATDSIRQFIEQHLSHLKGQLEQHGFEIHQITCRVRAAEELAQLSLFDGVVSQGESVLNIVV